MWSSLSGGALGRLVILFITASLFWACGKPEPRCVAGTAEGECAHPQACGEGFECRWDICYGGEVKPPDTYFYTDRLMIPTRMIPTRMIPTRGRILRLLGDPDPE
jgi:hypothetical protein